MIHQPCSSWLSGASSHSRPWGPATWNKSFHSVRLLFAIVTVKLLLSAGEGLSPASAHS